MIMLLFYLVHFTIFTSNVNSQLEMELLPSTADPFLDTEQRSPIAAVSYPTI